MCCKNFMILSDFILLTSRLLSNEFSVMDIVGTVGEYYDVLKRFFSILLAYLICLSYFYYETMKLSLNFYKCFYFLVKFGEAISEHIGELVRVSDRLFPCIPVEVLLNAFPGVVVIDEAYIDFSSQKSWLDRLNEFPNLIITQTLSKAYGMAGIRLGICYASSEIIAVLNKIKPPYNVNELTQQRAVKRVLNQNKVQHEIEILLEERKKLLIKLKSISFIEKIYPTDANFVLIKVDNAAKRYHELLEKGIVIRNRTTQPLCENSLRLTIGTKNENNFLIKTLREISK